MSAQLRFSFPMPINVTNSRQHWRAAHREKKTYAKRLDELQAAGVLPPPPERPLQKVMVESTMYLGNAMDDDNAMARHKPLIDWLKTRGYLVDDRKKNILWHSLPAQVVQRKDKAYRIELILTPLAA